MWRALHAVIFGAPKRAQFPAAAAQAADFARFQALVEQSPVQSAPWRTRNDSHKGPHGFIAVVGESHYQDTLRGLSVLFETIERTERTFTASLVAEPSNPFDPNAVKVTTEDGTTIGYLAREMAATFQKRLLRQPTVVRCPAQLRGGSDGESIGVVLDFEDVHV
jgi:HIRAN domain.